MPGTLWATAFHDPCVELLGMTGEEMHTLEQKAATAEESQADLDARLLALCLRRQFTVFIRVKADARVEGRADVSIMRAEPLDLNQHSNFLLNSLLKKFALEGGS